MSSRCSKPPFLPALLALLLAGGIVSCSARHQTAEKQETDSAPIEECEAFLTSLGHCFTTLGPADVAEARVAQARGSIDAQRALAPRAAVREQCLTGLAKMTCR